MFALVTFSNSFAKTTLKPISSNNKSAIPTFANNDIDCNTSTVMTSPAALTNGGDVPYTIENDIYYTFCPQTTGTWVVDIVPTNCVTSTGTPTNLNGYQVAIFQGTTSNLNTGNDFWTDLSSVSTMGSNGNKFIAI